MEIGCLRQQPGCFSLTIIKFTIICLVRCLPSWSENRKTYERSDVIICCSLGHVLTNYVLAEFVIIRFFFFSAVEKQQTTSRKLHKSELEQKMLSRKLFFKSNLQNLSTLFFEQTLIKSCWYQCENHSLWLENKKSWKSNRKTLRLNINIVHHPVLSPRWIIQVFLNFPPHATSFP